MLFDDQIPEWPTQIHIEITSKCNLACGFCPVHRVTRGEPLSKDEILGAIRQAATFNPDYIDFINYNEPLLSKEFWEYAELVKSLIGGGRLGVVSNGTVMTEAIANRIINLPPKQMVFSVDAFTAETYAKVRPRWTSAGAVEDVTLRDQIYANVNLYLECVEKSGTGRWPVIEMVVCDLNFHEVDAVKQYWVDRLHNQILIINCTGRGGERAFTAPNDNPCRVILDGLWILSDGRVVACCEDWNAVDAVGDIRKESLAEIWNGEKIRHFRECHFSGRKKDISVCANCQTSQDEPNHYKYPDRTNKAVLAEIQKKSSRRLLTQLLPGR